MLSELSVKDLGVIDDLVVEMGPGLIAITGETGAGKTLIVEALELLTGGRADPAAVRSGAKQAIVEGRFIIGEEETVLAREIPCDGRSRAYLDGRMATAAALSEKGAGLVELYGQHAHQSLLSRAVQRAALDRFAAVTGEDVRQAKEAIRRLEGSLESLGGDERALARETEMLRYQLDEIDGARLKEVGEEDALRGEEAVLGQAEALRVAAEEARLALFGEGAARDQLAAAYGSLGRHVPLKAVVDRLGALQAELDDLSSELRTLSESFEDDPERLARVQERLRLLAELRRKYGPTMAEVIEFGRSARGRLADLARSEEKRAELLNELDACRTTLSAAEGALGRARRTAAPRLAEQIETRLRQLGMSKARFEVNVSAEGSGDEVEFLLGANPGEPALPLSSVASGGELARAMLAIRLVLTGAPPTLVFDEVDAGIGGQAALSVGRALSELATRHQVLVVTHLAQVAAFAGVQIAVTKDESSGRTLTRARPVSGGERLTELSRMLSGQPTSVAARRHAEELLKTAGSAGNVTTSGTLSERTPGRRP